jgi:histidinol-phosphatase (PHP family)
MAREYWGEMIEMINGGGFDILSHVDVVKRYAFQVYKQFDIRDFEEQIRAVWAACLDKGIIPEINTSAQRMLVAQPHPTIDALRWYREMGGELLSLGSDSHNSAHLGFWFEEAVHMAKAAGFTHLAKFTRRQISERVPI